MRALTSVLCADLVGDHMALQLARVLPHVDFDADRLTSPSVEPSTVVCVACSRLDWLLFQGKLASRAKTNQVVPAGSAVGVARRVCHSPKQFRTEVKHRRSSLFAIKAKNLLKKLFSEGQMIIPGFSTELRDLRV
ncbi:uncharacterized protein LOC119169522 [Rhipicephalus microplus]|uniref:uncharacterized protein LOC119169522 n=1 Tax=Rhipicephalus microplus TaxID=6941 RepID=UPI003F6C8E13